MDIRKRDNLVDNYIIKIYYIYQSSLYIYIQSNCQETQDKMNSFKLVSCFWRIFNTIRGNKIPKTISLSLIYGFWLHLWWLQTLLKYISIYDFWLTLRNLQTLLHNFRFTTPDYPFGIFKLFFNNFHFKKLFKQYLNKNNGYKRIIKYMYARHITLLYLHGVWWCW